MWVRIKSCNSCLSGSCYHPRGQVSQLFSGTRSDFCSFNRYTWVIYFLWLNAESNQGILLIVVFDALFRQFWTKQCSSDSFMLVIETLCLRPTNHAKADQQGILWNGREISVWNMEDARVEWNGRFQEWNGRQSSIPIPYQIPCIVFTKKIFGWRVVINNIVIKVFNFNTYVLFVDKSRYFGWVNCANSVRTASY